MYSLVGTPGVRWPFLFYFRQAQWKLWEITPPLEFQTLESPLDCKEIKPVSPKGNQPWIVIGRIDADDEAPILWPPDVKSQLIGKDPDARKDWRHEEKGMTEDKMVGWHHPFDGREFAQAPEVGDGQGSLACCTWVSYIAGRFFTPEPPGKPWINEYYLIIYIYMLTL